METKKDIKLEDRIKLNKFLEQHSLTYVQKVNMYKYLLNISSKLDTMVGRLEILEYKLRNKRLATLERDTIKNLKLKIIGVSETNKVNSNFELRLLELSKKNVENKLKEFYQKK